MEFMTHRQYHSPAKEKHPSTALGMVAVVAVLAVALPMLSAAGGPDQDATLIDLLASSEAVVRARIHKVEDPPFQQVRLAVLEIMDTVKGKVPERGLLVAEEKLFPSDEFALQEGREALLFLRPVPNDSRWAEHRAKGLRFIVAKAGQSITTMGPTEARQAAEFLKTYMLRSASKDKADQRALFDFLLASLNSPVQAVQEAAASAFPELGKMELPLSREDGAAVKRFILNSRRSLPARVRMIEKISQTKLFEEIAPAIIRDRPELRLAAFLALGSNKEVQTIPQDALLAGLHDPDPQVRKETLHVMAASHTPEQAPFIRDTSLNDPDPQIRAKAMAVLAGRDPEANWDVLSRGLDDKSPYVVYLAAGAIRDMADDRSAPELSRLLESENPKARFIGVLILGTMKDAPARRILEDSAQMNPDPRTRELCRKILKAGVLDDQAVREFLGMERLSLPGR